MGRRKAKKPEVDQRLQDARRRLAALLYVDVPVGLRSMISSMVADLEELCEEKGRKLGFSLCMQMLLDSKLQDGLSAPKNDGSFVVVAKRKAITGSWWKQLA